MTAAGVRGAPARGAVAVAVGGGERGSAEVLTVAKRRRRLRGESAGGGEAKAEATRRRRRRRGKAEEARVVAARVAAATGVGGYSEAVRAVAGDRLEGVGRRRLVSLRMRRQRTRRPTPQARPTTRAAP